MPLQVSKQIDHKPELTDAGPSACHCAMCIINWLPDQKPIATSKSMTKTKATRIRESSRAALWIDANCMRQSVRDTLIRPLPPRFVMENLLRRRGSGRQTPDLTPKL